MGGGAERILTYVAVGSALVTSIALVHRELRASKDSGRVASVDSRYVPGWRTLLPAGREFGPASARIKLLVFSDFECPFCKRFASVADEFALRYPDDVSVVFLHFPLSNHRFAIPSARAAECAGRVSGRFAEMARTLYQYQDSLGLKSWSELGVVAGVGNLAAFDACTRETGPLDAIENGLAAGQVIPVRGTPAVLLNGWYYSAPPSLEELVRAAGELLAGKSPYAGLPLLAR